MRHLILTIVIFAVAAGINTGSVVLQRRNGFLTRRFGARGWYLHLALITPGWVVFLILLARIGNHVRWPLPSALRPVGVVLLLMSSGTWLWAFAQLGPERVANGYFFGRGPREPVEGGLFRQLRNPMYDSYLVALVGLALFRAKAVYLVLALESYLLLNLMEARVENRPFRKAQL